MECLCSKPCEIELQCKHGACLPCACAAAVASGTCPRCRESILNMEQKGGNLLVHLGRVRALLVLQDGESIHNLVTKLFGLSPSTLKVVSKGRIRSAEEAIQEWRADPGQVFFVVGSPGTHENLPRGEQLAKPKKESLEQFKEWEREEKARLAARKTLRQQSPNSCERLHTVARGFSQVLTRNSVMETASSALQGVYLFVSTLWNPFTPDEEDVARARAAEHANVARRPMGQIRRAENHTTPMGGG